MTTPSTPNLSPAQIAVEALRTQALILSLIRDIRTAIPVKVMAVHPGEGTPPAIGTVDVQPLVQAVDGAGKLWKLGKTYGAQFSRIQAGNTAIVVDPNVGDIGLAVACDRDISSVIAAAGIAGPGSARIHDISDLVYLYSILSVKAITQYILANAQGLTLLTPNTLTLQGGQINMVGPINANGAIISSAGEITDALGVVLGTHIHSASGGTGNGGPPV